jgi:hypothetical protein
MGTKKTTLFNGAKMELSGGTSIEASVDEGEVDLGFSYGHLNSSVKLTYAETVILARLLQIIRSPNVEQDVQCELNLACGALLHVERHGDKGVDLLVTTGETSTWQYMAVEAGQEVDAIIGRLHVCAEYAAEWLLEDLVWEAAKQSPHKDDLQELLLMCGGNDDTK